MMKLIITAVTIASVAVITGCRTSEANYRAAYEQAVAGRSDESGIDNTVYDRIRREAITSTRIIDGDTGAVKRERVKPVDAGNGSVPAEAYVVVAQFRQLFNARSLCSRLKANGYPDAMLLSTREPVYYVAIAGGSTDDMASLCLRYASGPVAPVKDPYPLVLQPSR